MGENRISQTWEATRRVSRRSPNIIQSAIIVKGLVGNGLCNGFNGWVVGGGIGWGIFVEILETGFFAKTRFLAGDEVGLATDFVTDVTSGVVGRGNWLGDVREILETGFFAKTRFLAGDEVFFHLGFWANSY